MRGPTAVGILIGPPILTFPLVVLLRVFPLPDVSLHSVSWKQEDTTQERLLLLSLSTSVPFILPQGSGCPFSEAFWFGVIVTPKLVLMPAAGLGFHVFMVYIGGCGHCFAPSCPEAHGFTCPVNHVLIVEAVL